MFTIINSLPGRTISTFPRKGLNYDMYNHASFGPAAGFLPIPPTIGQAVAPGQSAVNLDPRHYEAFFQYHLRQEAEAVRTLLVIFFDSSIVEHYNWHFAVTTCKCGRVKGCHGNDTLMKDGRR